MLRLTQLGEGTEDTRRRGTTDEIVTTCSEVDAVERVIKKMADARLLPLPDLIRCHNVFSMFPMKR